LAKAVLAGAIGALSVIPSASAADPIWPEPWCWKNICTPEWPEQWCWKNICTPEEPQPLCFKDECIP
jgi:hypothetical protein